MRTHTWKTLRNGDLELSLLGLGGAPLGNMYRAIPEPVAQATLDAAHAGGIRYLDTAPLYGLGLSEERFGRVGDPDAVPAVVAAFQEIIDDAARQDVAIATLERFAFYEHAARAFAVVATGERRLYGNILLAKGIVRPEELPEAWR